MSELGHSRPVPSCPRHPGRDRMRSYPRTCIDSLDLPDGQAERCVDASFRRAAVPRADALCAENALGMRLIWSGSEGRAFSWSGMVRDHQTRNNWTKGAPAMVSSLSTCRYDQSAYICWQDLRPSQSFSDGNPDSQEACLADAASPNFLSYPCLLSAL